jgi:hypothetical protein
MTSAVAPGLLPSSEGRALRIITWCEWLACAAVIVGLVLLRINFASQAGALWRDEVQSVNVARDPQFPLWYDSFPVLWIAFLRMWITVCGSSDDASVRQAGLICSLLLLAAAVWAPRGRSRTVPWTSLVLFGMAPIVITYGTEVRGYALGVATQLWMLGALERWLLRPTRRSGINLVIASLVAVQAAYANSFLLLAGSLSAGLVCLMEKRWRALLALTANGVLAAATVSPYVLLLLPSVATDWVVIVRNEFPLSWYVLRTIEALASGGWLPGLAWWLLCGAVFWGAFKGLVHPERREQSDVPGYREWNRAFEPLLLVFGTILVWVYLMSLKVPTTEWYYLPLLGLWAFCIDSAIGTWSRRPGRCALKLAAALILGVVQIPAAWDAANVRMTNVDLLAESVAAVATKNDLVVVKPWTNGITLQRYYHGAAPWICLPEVKNTEVAGVLLHSDGYRAFKQAMMRKKPLEAELSRIRETLRHGGRVFVVGDIQLLRRGQRPVRLPQAPKSPSGWSMGPYQEAWTQQLCYELQTDAEVHRMSVEVRQPVNQFESPQLYQALVANPLGSGLNLLKGKK